MPPGLSNAVDSRDAGSIENPVKWHDEHWASNDSVSTGTLNRLVVVFQKFAARVSSHGHRVRSLPSGGSSVPPGWSCTGGKMK